MSTLWILQTNEQTFLDDCRDFQVYGVETPKFKGLEQMLEGDTVLLRLRLRQTQQELAYLGPYRVTSQIRPWVKNIKTVQGIWHKVIGQDGNNPRWLKKYPWCVFLSPSNEFINDLRELSISHSVKACEPIKSPLYEEILSSLLQSEFLPDSRVNSYRTIRGVWVRSRAEYMIDNWFTAHGIVTYYEKSIYLDSCRIVPDWFIPSLNLYLEYLGLKGNPKYDKSWNFKENAYQKHKVNYVTLDDKDLMDLDFTIPSKIPQLKTMGILK
jgi:hypothetical protein